MTDAVTTNELLDSVLAVLRDHEPELRKAGLRRMSLFGSVARGDAGPESDVDLAVELDPAARMDFFQLIGLEDRLSKLLGRPAHLLPEPVEKQRLQANIDRDRQRAY